MTERDPTRREFLLKLARSAGYTAPAVATFAVMPAILQGQSSTHKHHHGHPAPPVQPSTQEKPGGQPPSETHPSPGKKRT